MSLINFYLLVFIILLIVISGFLSGSETAITAISKARIISKLKKGNKAAEYVKQIIDNKDKIMFSVIDNGIGFENFEGNIKDILNPYFTTKKKGTGLGLSIVNKIINDHDGSIDFIPLDIGAKIEIMFLKK